MERPALVVAWLAASLLGCTPGPDYSGLPVVRPRVVATLPHAGDRLFTEGLVYHEGFLYEGTGLVNATALRRIDPDTGALLAQKNLEAYFPGGEMYFGEGITVWNGAIVQLSYRRGRAYRYTLGFRKLPAEHAYEGEGWGLTHDGTHLVQGDGSHRLRWRDPDTFEVRRTVEVTAGGGDVEGLNELEYGGGRVLANVFLETHIVVIDPQRGAVTAVVDGSGLTCSRTPGLNNVLNGIAHAPDRGTYFLTGKNCPVIEEVVLTLP